MVAGWEGLPWAVLVVCGCGEEVEREVALDG